jgi:hypothetical protein
MVYVAHCEFTFLVLSGLAIKYKAKKDRKFARPQDMSKILQDYFFFDPFHCMISATFFCDQETNETKVRKSKLFLLSY